MTNIEDKTIDWESAGQAVRERGKFMNVVL